METVFAHLVGVETAVKQVCDNTHFTEEETSSTTL